MNKIALLFIFFSLCSCASITKRTPSSEDIDKIEPYLGNTKIDVISYSIDIFVKSMPVDEIIFKSKIKLKTLGELNSIKLHIDTLAMKVEKVNHLGADARFRIIKGFPTDLFRQGNQYGLSGDVLEINLQNTSKLNQEYEFEVSYSVKKSDWNDDKGLFFVKKEKPEDKDFLYSRNWPYYARYWLPSNDSPNDTALVNYNLYVPKEYMAIANGRLLKGNEKTGSGVMPNGLRLFQWKQSMPTTTYNFVFGVGQFDVFKKDICFNSSDKASQKQVSCNVAKNKIPMIIYYNNKNQESKDLMKFVNKIEGSTVYFSNLFGKYIFEKVGIVFEPSYPFSMESTSLIVLNQPSSAVHEVVHHWWGNNVHIKHWGDFWISEGFTTYFTGIYDEFLTGTNSAFLDDDPKALNHGERTDPNSIFDSVPYNKGAQAVGALRRKFVQIADLNTVKTDPQAPTRAFFNLSKKLYVAYSGKELSTAEFVKFVKENSKSVLNEVGILTADDVINENIQRWAKYWFVDEESLKKEAF